MFDRELYHDITKRGICFNHFAEVNDWCLFQAAIEKGDSEYCEIFIDPLIKIGRRRYADYDPEKLLMSLCEEASK